MKGRICNPGSEETPRRRVSVQLPCREEADDERGTDVSTKSPQTPDPNKSPDKMQRKVSFGGCGGGGCSDSQADDEEAELSEAESALSPRTPANGVSRQSSLRRRSISWSQVVNNAYMTAVDSAEGERSQDDDMPPIRPCRLWSGRSFSSVTDFPFIGDASPFLPAGYATPKAGSTITPRPGTAPTTPKARRFGMQPDEPPSIERGGGRLEDASEDENEGRFQREFNEVEKIGEGHFSVVFHARNTTDRCMYALKRTKQIAKGKAKRQLQEAVVMASVALEAEGCPHIVRYFSSWFEGSQLFIQMELCEGSLRDHLGLLCEMPRDPRCNTKEIMDVLRHVSEGLRAMHSCGFAHLDIKPDNVMRGKGSSGRWKIGDLGLAVAAMGSGCDEVCEGDCRYLAREVLQGDLTDLEKGDVFSLGIMAYEIATNPRPLPCDGEEWQALRDGKLDTSLLADLEPSLRELLFKLVQQKPAERPACKDILERLNSTSADKVQPNSPQSENESEEVRRLHKELEELGRKEKESQLMADRYRKEVIRLRLQKGRCFGRDRPSDDLPESDMTMGHRYSI